jgi:hypothetical protein
VCCRNGFAKLVRVRHHRFFAFQHVFVSLDGATLQYIHDGSVAHRNRCSQVRQHIFAGSFPAESFHGLCVFATSVVNQCSPLRYPYCSHYG